MPRKPNSRISTLGSRLTSIVSVTLVLVILGLVGLALRASSALGDDIRRNIGFIVKLAPEATDANANALKQRLSAAPFVESYVFTDADQILVQESELMGEDIAGLLEENPFGDEFDIKVLPAYASSDSINRLAAAYAQAEGVDEVITESAVIDNINDTLQRISLVMGAIALALLIISFVLINNTVSLAVYSRRFIIHTMTLVGATAGFIRRPFVLAGLSAGLIAGIVAAAVLCGLRWYGAQADPALAALLPWRELALMSVAVIAVGAAICSLASALAANHYLRSDYDDMFMK